MLLKLEIKPISLNNIYRNAGRRGRIKTREYLRWRAEAGWLLKPQLHGRNAPLDEYGIRIEVGRSQSRADIDNLIKPISDLLQSLNVIRNDRLCSDCHIKYIKGLNYTTINVWPIL